MTPYDHLITYQHEGGQEYDFDEYTLPGVPWFAGIEENIRQHFQAWRTHAAAFTAQRAAMLAIIDHVSSMAGAFDSEEYYADQAEADPTGERETS